MIYTLLFAACSGVTDTGEFMPIEIIECTHPDSRFEGVVRVEVEDSVVWNTVDFEISQDDHVWKTSLQTEEGRIWWTRMQLYELDCYNDFDYGVIYGSD